MATSVDPTARPDPSSATTCHSISAHPTKRRARSPMAGPADTRSKPLELRERQVVTGFHERARPGDTAGFGLALAFERRRPERCGIRTCCGIRFLTAGALAEAVSRIGMSPSDVRVFGDPQGIRPADISPCSCDTQLKPGQQLRLAAAARDQMKNMHRRGAGRFDRRGRCAARAASDSTAVPD